MASHQQCKDAMSNMVSLSVFGKRLYCNYLDWSITSKSDQYSQYHPVVAFIPWNLNPSSPPSSSPSCLFISDIQDPQPLLSTTSRKTNLLAVGKVKYFRLLVLFCLSQQETCEGKKGERQVGLRQINRRVRGRAETDNKGTREWKRVWREGEREWWRGVKEW